MVRRQTMAAVVAALIWATSGVLAVGADAVVESAREIPVAYQVDVVIVGGGTGAVSAAVAASEAGTRVFLAAPHPYLGDDMTATLQLWLEQGEQPKSPLAAAVYDDPLSAKPRPPRPLHVKTTLEKALLDAGVDFLYSCYATDVLRDAHGALAGIVMANRAGRQAVLARTIIDATERSEVARLAGARFRPYPAGVQTFRRVVIGGEPVALDRGSVRMVEPFGSFKTIEYTLELDMPDGSWGSFVAADQAARTLTYHPAQQITSDRLFQVPPDAMHGRQSIEGDGQPVEALALDAFRPQGVDRLYVLGGAADISRARAARLMRPLELIDLGQRIGAAAAEEAAVRVNWPACG
jgi:hypothetical protein